MRKIFLALMACLYLCMQAAVIEQTYEHELSADETFNSLGTWSLSGFDWNVQAVEFVGNNVNKLKFDKGKTVNAKWNAPEGKIVNAVTFTPSRDCKVKNVYVTYFLDTSLGLERMGTDNVMQKVYYDLTGKQVNSKCLKSGIYIVRQGVKIQKIIIK